MKQIMSWYLFFAATVAMAMHDKMLIADNKNYSLSDIVDIDQWLKSSDQPQTLKILFDKNLPSITLGTLKKRFIPYIQPYYGSKYNHRCSSAFDTAEYKFRYVDITNTCGEEITIDFGQESLRRMAFSHDGTKIFGSIGDNDHFIFAEKSDGHWVKLPRKTIPLNFIDKPGYYQQGETIVYKNPAVVPVSHEDYYLGFMSGDDLIFTDVDAQRNYVYDSNGLFSPNKKYIAQKFKRDFEYLIQVSEIKISNKELSLSLLYEVRIDDLSLSQFGLTDLGSLLFYNGKKAQTGGLNKLTNEHFLFLMLGHLFGKTSRELLTMARLANILVDHGPLKENILSEWQGRVFDLKLTVLDLLEKLHGETRFIDMPISISDNDRDFRKKMISRCQNKEEAKKLLQKISLTFNGRNSKPYREKLLKMSLDEKTSEKLLNLFPRNDDLKEIIEKYELALTRLYNFAD
jgi:hypothetical protein